MVGMAFTGRLTGSGPTRHDVGGKAEALDRLIGIGMPVPAAGVVNAAAYHRFTDAPALRSLLDELRTTPVPGPERHAEARARVDQAFLDHPLPPDLADAIHALADDVGRGGPLAVRSSATAEDLAHASFAGQYRSFLDVPPEEVADAVRLTWASLWHPAPRIYRRFRSIPEDDLAMGVVFMAMLEPTEAGVLFTVDPGGVEGALRLELVSGLGEALVSGAATPEVIVVDRVDAAEELGRRSPPLGQLADLALAIEEAEGAAQDIEWAIEDGELFLLQARPVTGVGAHEREAEPFDTVGHGDTTYTTSGIGEMLPGLLPPRVWEMNSWFLEEGFRRLFDRLGAVTARLDEPQALLARFRGRAALDLDRMREAVAAVPGGSPDELEREYFGRVLDEDAHPTAPSAERLRTVQAARTARARLDAVQESAIVVQAADRLIDAEPDITAMRDAQLFAYRARLLQLAARAVAAEVAVAAMATAGYRALQRRLARDRHLDASAAEQLTREATRTPDTTAGLAMLLDALAVEYRGAPQIAACEEVDWSGAADLLPATEEGRAFVADFEAALRRAGSSAVCGGPTWSDAAPTAWRAFLAIPPADDEEQEPEPARLDSRSKRRQAATAAQLLARREHTKAAVLQVGGAIWRADRELARRLVASGRLEAVEDVDLVTSSELGALIGGAGPSLATIAQRRRQLDQHALDGPLPMVFRGAPTAARQRPVRGERFRGWGASAGHFEGPARVVRTPAGGGLRRGEVMVARRTDASWAPLFLLAGGVVVEEGGPLSHAAIVARELGMPAVVNVPGIVDRIEREVADVALAIDGTTGEVTVHRVDGRNRTPCIPDERSAAAGPSDGVVPVDESHPVDELGRLSVFVTGLIGAGALLSGVMSVSQALSGRRAQARIRARADTGSAMLVAGVVNGFDRVRSSPVGIRPRPFYARLAATLFVLAAVVTVHGVSQASTDDAWTPLWRAMSFSAAAELAVGVVLLVLATARWPDIPPVIRRSLPTAGRRWPSLADTLGPVGAPVVATSLGLVAALTLAHRFDVGVVARADRWIYDVVGAGRDEDRWGPEWIDILGSSDVMIPVALLVAISVIRCRPLALAIPATIALAGGLHNGLAGLVERARPELGERVGWTDSFPGGFVLEVTLVLGFLPLAVDVLVNRPRVTAWSRVISLGLLVVLIVDAVRLGSHWPTDNLAGFAMGVAFVVAVHRLARTSEFHEYCKDCPTMRAAQGEETASVGTKNS